MVIRVLYALISSSIVTGSAWTITNIVDKVPDGPAREAIERGVLAPGQTILDKLDDNKDFRKLRKKGRKRLKKGAKALKKERKRLQSVTEDLTGDLTDAIEDSDLIEIDRLTRLYNVASWAVVGFGLSLLLTLVMGISSLKTALALGVKVTFFMIFLQAALVFGGVLVYHHITG